MEVDEVSRMFVIANEKTKKPIKVWLPDETYIEETCLQQAYNLANLPFIHQWVALMPDTHAGMGMPIGGVIATENVVIPNAVGVDIGCGMAFVSTNIKVSDISDVQTGNGSLIQGIIADILRNIPTGFNRHKKVQSCETLDKAKKEMEKYSDNPELCKQIEAGYYQVGSLGGGNHFIELQEDDEGYLGIMVHSGSRNFGKQVCDYFHHKARELNRKWRSEVPEEWRLAFLPCDIPEGQQYIRWMNLALDFAAENRAKMLDVVCEIVEKWIGKHTDFEVRYVSVHKEMENKVLQATTPEGLQVELLKDLSIANREGAILNCHHNYAALEHHYGKNVWVHRKGATRAAKIDLAVIPGAMGSYSYVVRGLGNEMSFFSSSHGAGRLYSRKGAMAKFSTEEVMVDLQEQGVVLGKHNKKDVAEESRFAYKNIEEVMEFQKDLVLPVKRLKTIGVVKG